MPRWIAALALLVAMTLAACGGSATSAPGDGTGTPTATADDGTVTDSTTSSDDGTSTDDGTGAAGDRSKGIFHAEVTGGAALTIDLGFAPPPVSNFHYDGDTAYLVWVDHDAVVFMTVAPSGDFTVQFGDGKATLGLGTDTCDLHLDRLDGSGAKGSFSCRGTVLITEAGLPTIDVSGTFEAHT